MFKATKIIRCADYDDPTKILDENADEYLCEYCGMRGECDGKGNIQLVDPKKLKSETPT